MTAPRGARLASGQAGRRGRTGHPASPRAGRGGSGASNFLIGPAAPTGIRFWPYLAPLLACAAVISFCDIRSLDLWWHLKTGAWILQNRAIPRLDPFSYTAAGQPWVSHEWLFGLISYWAYRAGGTAAIVAGKALLVALLLGLTAWTARLRRALPGATLLVLAAAYAVSRMRFTERPELLSIPLAALFLLVCEKSAVKPGLLALLPAAQLLWVNLHGGTALLGWALAGALLLDCAWERRPAAGGVSRAGSRALAPHAAALAGVVAASFLNPHGYKALFYGLLRTESPLDNKEFQSLASTIRAGVDLSIVLYLVFAALLALFFALRPRRVRLYEWLLLPLLLALTLVFFRFRPLLVFLLAPTLAWHLSQGRWLGRIRAWVPALAATLLIARVVQLESQTYFYRFGVGVHSGVFAVSGVDFLEASGIRGHMFNTYGIGGYLIWRLGPDHKVFIDGREDVYLGPGILSEYVHAFDSRKNWRDLVEKYGIDYAVVRYPEQPPARPEDSLDTLAFPRAEWALVYFDDVVAIYVRRNGRNDAVLESEIRTVQPMQVSAYLEPLARDPDTLSLFRAEMAVNASEHPESFRNHFTLGLLAVKLGPVHLQEALVEFRRAAAINPDFAPAHANIGTLCLHLGRYREAREAFERALSLEPSPFVSAQLERLSKNTEP